MAYSDTEARELIVKAGHELVNSGLIARTWGNISARISDTQFIITPSGRSYEKMTPDQLVVVNSADCSWSGGIKPSSEKRVHAAAYLLRPDVNFVIHTHQLNATIAGLEGVNITDYGRDSAAVLGDCVPCAQYGMSTTKRLSRMVAAAIAEYPESRTILMKHHGALCLGSGYEDTFAMARLLETVCGAHIERIKQGRDVPGEAAEADLGSSVRTGSRFRITCGGSEEEFAVDSDLEQMPHAAAIHAALYGNSDIGCIRQVKTPSVVAVSAQGKTLRPLIDDMAQITGINVRCVSGADETPDVIVRKMSGRNAVLIAGSGALCTGHDEDDAEAACIILNKECEAELYVEMLPSRKYLAPLDAFIQRLFYVRKYSKLKK